MRIGTSAAIASTFGVFVPHDGVMTCNRILSVVRSVAVGGPEDNILKVSCCCRVQGSRAQNCFGTMPEAPPEALVVLPSTSTPPPGAQQSHPVSWRLFFCNGRLKRYSFLPRLQPSDDLRPLEICQCLETPTADPSSQGPLSASASEGLSPLDPQADYAAHWLRGQERAPWRGDIGPFLESM